MGSKENECKQITFPFVVCLLLASFVPRVIGFEVESMQAAAITKVSESHFLHFSQFEKATHERNAILIHSFLSPTFLSPTLLTF